MQTFQLYRLETSEVECRFTFVRTRRIHYLLKEQRRKGLESSPTFNPHFLILKDLIGVIPRRVTVSGGTTRQNVHITPPSLINVWITMVGKTVVNGTGETNLKYFVIWESLTFCYTTGTKCLFSVETIRLNCI